MKIVMAYSKKEYLIWLDSFRGIEYKHKNYLYENYKNVTIKDNVKSQENYIRKFLGDGVFNTLLIAATDEHINYVLSSLDKSNVKYFTIADSVYPEELKEVPCPPLVLYYKGNIELLKDKKFAVVGSRKTLPFIVAKTEEIVSTLNRAGITAVTGLAEGGDEAVITAGIKTGKIISVLASGFDCVYPKANQGLFERVCKSGLVLSEYPPETKSERYFFPVRNRIIAGLGMGALIVSGGEKSGTFYTAEYTEVVSRQVFTFPYSINVSSGVGCNKLLQQGAYLTMNAEDILDFYGIEVPKEQTVELTDREKQLYDIIKENEVHIDKLCEMTGKKAFELIPVLSMLEIKKLIVKLGGNRYSKV